MNKLPPLYVLWIGISLAAVALFAEAVRGFSNAPAPPRMPLAIRPPAAGPQGNPAERPPALPGSSAVPVPGADPNPAPDGIPHAPAPPLLPPLPPPPTGPPPRIHVEQDTVDFGSILQGTEPSATFVFHNRGTGPLHLLEAVASCGCAAVMPDTREIPPGGRGEVRIVFKSGRYVGPQHKTISVRTNDPEHPVTVLHLKTEVMPAFLFDPPTLVMGDLKRGAPVVREITLRETQGRPFKVGTVASTLPFVTAELLPDDAAGDGVARRVRVTVHPDGAPGGFVGHITFTVDRPGIVPTLVVQGVIAGNVSIFPQSLFLGMARQDQAFPLQSLVLRARGETPIGVQSVETSVPWLKADVKTLIPDKLLQIDITVDPVPPPGRFEETVRILTTSDPPPPFSVTVSGVVRKVP